jgi:predicted nucleic acid-binding protein
MHGILVDAGPLIAILHRRDQDHASCVAVLRDLKAPLLTTWAPVTEAMYLLDFSQAAQAALLEMIERRALRILPLAASDMPDVRFLIKKYYDLPMDFADATLVHAANRENIDHVFTLDRRDFSVYRLSNGGAFTILPA